MNRKTLTIIAVLVVVILGTSGYLYFTKKSTLAPQTQPGATFPGAGQPVTSFGEGGPTTTPVATTTTNGEPAALPRLHELHNLPVADITFIETGKGATRQVSARYIERGLGHIFDTQLETYNETRIGNETRSRISEAFWGNGGKSIVVRSLDENDGLIKSRILNFTTPIVQATSTDFLKTEEIYLPDEIPFLAVSEDQANKIFFLQNSSLGAVGTVTSFKNTGASKIFSSTATEWLPQFPKQSLVTLTTRPSANVPGYLFFLNTQTKALTKILNGINGLTTLTNKDGNSVLYSETVDNTPTLSVYNVAKKEVLPLSLQTLPEKCVWSAKTTTIAYCAVPKTIVNAQYPDQWYQGLLSFSDNIWKIDTKTALVEMVLDPSTLGGSNIDMINLKLSSDDSYIMFTNKITGNPWVYRLADTQAAAIIPTSSMTKIK